MSPEKGLTRAVVARQPWGGSIARWGARAGSRDSMTDLCDDLPYHEQMLQLHLDPQQAW